MMLRLGITRLTHHPHTARRTAPSRGRWRYGARRTVASALVIFALPLSFFVAVASPASASNTTYTTSISFSIYDLSSGAEAGANGTLTVSYNDQLEFIACLDSTDSSQGDHSIQINDTDSWYQPGGTEDGQDGCFSAVTNWTSFTNGSPDTFTAHFGGCSDCGGGVRLAASASSSVSVALNGDLSWSSAAGGGTVSYGTSISDSWSASSAHGAPVSLSYSGSVPTNVGWNGGGFSGTADEDGSFGGTVTATESGGNNTSSSISAGWGLTVDPVAPGWTSAPSGRTVDVGEGGWSDSFAVSSAPTSSFGISSGSLPPGVGLTDNGNNTASISGAPSASGSYTATIDASNPGGTIYQNYTMTVDQAPAISSASLATFTAGSAGSFGFTVASGTYPTASLSESGALPIGVELNSSGMLSGTPIAGAAGTYPITVTATNAAGSGTQDFVLIVAEPTSYTGTTVTATGTGTPGTSANGTNVLTAKTDDPSSVIVDGAGDRFVVDTGANMIQEIPDVDTTAYGVTMTANEVYDIAGNGLAGYTGDGAAGYNAELDHPSGIALDASGNLFIADTGNNVIRVLVAKSGTILGQSVSAGDIYTVVGTGASGYYGDTRPASEAKLDAPTGVALDPAGDVFIADSANNVIREVAATSSGSMTADDIYTVVGTGSAGTFTPGASATTAALDDPTAIAIGPDGDLDIADTGSNVVAVDALVTASSFGESMTAGDVYDLAGTGTPGTSGNGGSGLGALADEPGGLAIDSSGNVYFSDPSNGDVRVIAASDETLFGLAATAGDVYQLMSGLTDPVGIGVDPTGAVYVAEQSANEVGLLGTAPAITSAPSGVLIANASGSVTISASGQPAPTFSESGALPSGVSLAADGVVSGTPALGSAGSYSITVRASNGIGSVPSQNFVLTVDPATTSLALAVNPAPPVIASTATITVAVSPVPDAGTTVAIEDVQRWFDCPSAPVDATTGLATCSSSSIDSTTSDLVSATFSGDAQYASSLGSITITPSQAPTTLTLSASPSAPSALTTTTLSAVVSPVPTGGTVAFSDDDSYVEGCGAADVDTTTGIATCTTQVLSLPGSRHLLRELLGQ